MIAAMLLSDVDFIENLLLCDTQERTLEANQAQGSRQIHNSQDFGKVAARCLR